MHAFLEKVHTSHLRTELSGTGYRVHETVEGPRTGASPESATVVHREPFDERDMTNACGAYVTRTGKSYKTNKMQSIDSQSDVLRAQNR